MIINHVSAICLNLMTLSTFWQVCQCPPSLYTLSVHYKLLNIRRCLGKQIHRETGFINHIIHLATDKDKDKDGELTRKMAKFLLLQVIKHLLLVQRYTLRMRPQRRYETSNQGNLIFFSVFTLCITLVDVYN